MRALDIFVIAGLALTLASATPVLAGGKGGGGGGPTHSDMQATKQIDVSTPKISGSNSKGTNSSSASPKSYEAVSNGKHINRVKIELDRSTGK